MCGLMLLGVLCQDVSKELPLYLLSSLMITALLLITLLAKETIKRSHPEEQQHLDYTNPE